MTAPEPAKTGRVVLLGSLSRRIPNAEITSKVAGALRSETRSPVLRVELTSSDGDLALGDWPRLGGKRNGRFPMAERLRQEPEPKVRLKVTGNLQESMHVGAVLDRFAQHFAYVVVEANEGTPLNPLVECVDQAHASYLFLRQTPEDLYELSLLMREVRAQPDVDIRRVKPILYAEDFERARGIPALVEKSIGIPVHSCLRRFPDDPMLRGVDIGADLAGSFDASLRRLAREISGTRVGLALSSGGARGLAHIGVIQVLEENGIEIDAVAGSSMGAYVASIWGCGYNGGFMEKLACEVKPGLGLLKLADILVYPRRGFILGEKAKRRLKHTIGSAHFTDLVRPVRLVATRLDTLERTVFSSGEVASAVHASSAIPGVCVPVGIDGVTYIDGGIADPLPVDVLSEMGVNRIIAVNCVPTVENLRECVDRDRQIVERERRWSPMAFLNRNLNLMARGNVLDTLLRSINGAQIRVAEAASEKAHVVLRPLCCDGRWNDFGNAPKYIALGRRAAEEHLAEIRALAGKPPTPAKEEPYEPKSASTKMASAA